MPLHKMSHGRFNRHLLKLVFVSAPAYQKWNGFPDSPLLTADYPYQAIGVAEYQYSSYDALYLSKNKLWATSTGILAEPNINDIRVYYKSGSTWSYHGTYANASFKEVWTSNFQCNNPVYTDATLSVVKYSKTT